MKSSKASLMPTGAHFPKGWDETREALLAAIKFSESTRAGMRGVRYRSPFGSASPSTFEALAELECHIDDIIFDEAAGQAEARRSATALLKSIAPTPERRDSAGGAASLSISTTHVEVPASWAHDLAQGRFGHKNSAVSEERFRKVWHDYGKAVNENTEAYLKARDNLLIGHVVRRGDEEEDWDQSGGHSVEMMLRDLGQVAQNARMTMKLRNIGCQQDGKVVVEERVHLRKQYKLRCQEVSKCEAELAILASTTAKHGVQPSKRPRKKHNESFANVHGADHLSNSQIDTETLLFLEERKRSCLLDNLKSMTTLALMEADRNMVREMIQHLDELLHHIRKTDTPPGVAAGHHPLSNDKLLDVVQHPALSEYFKRQAHISASAVRRLVAANRDRDDLLRELVCDPLLEALALAVCKHLHDDAQEKQEVLAASEAAELLRMEQREKEKVDAKLRRRLQQEAESPVGSENERSAVACDVSELTRHVEAETDTDAGQQRGEQIESNIQTPESVTDFSKSKNETHNKFHEESTLLTSESAGPKDGSPNEIDVQEKGWEVTTTKKGRAKEKQENERKGKTKDSAHLQHERTTNRPMCNLVDQAGQVFLVRGFVCREFLRGNCQSEKCDKMHLTNMIGCRVACDYFLSGRCLRGAQCRYAHVSRAAIKAAVTVNPTVGEQRTATKVGGKAARRQEQRAPSGTDTKVTVPKVCRRVVEGSSIVLQRCARLAQLPHLPAIFVLLKTTSFGRLIEIGSEDHACPLSGKCLLCESYRLANLAFGPSEDLLLLDEASDILEAILEALPNPDILNGTTWDIVCTVTFALECVRLQLGPDQGSSSLGECNVKRNFGIDYLGADGHASLWTFEADVDCVKVMDRLAGAPEPPNLKHIALGPASIFRINRWHAERSSWLYDILAGQTLGVKLWNALGYSIDTAALANTTLSMIIVGRGSEHGVIVTHSDENVASEVVLWVTSIERQSCKNPAHLLRLLCADGWHVIALVFENKQL